MGKQISKIEDLGNKKNQKLFLAFATVFFKGNIQEAIDDLNIGIKELDFLENNKILPLENSPAEIQLRFTH